MNKSQTAARHPAVDLTSLHHFNESERLAALHVYDVLDSVPEQAYDDLTTLASSICRAPIALVSFVDHDRLWFKSTIGFDQTQIAREIGFCSHAILAPDAVFEVPDACEDHRFHSNPLVIGRPDIRCYAGASLISPQGLPIGTICVIDRTPRRLAQQEREGLASLARQVVAQLELRKAVKSLDAEALTDPLTGAWNRRAFDRRLKDEWSNHAKANRPMSLLLFDIDRFKTLNDEFGHAVGDETLVEVVRLARQALRAEDILCRHGGEEFSVVLPDTDQAGALVVAEKVRSAIANGRWLHRKVTASVGVASTVPRMLDDPYAAVARVDKAMYLAKHGGRDCVRTAG